MSDTESHTTLGTIPPSASVYRRCDGDSMSGSHYPIKLPFDSD